MLQTREGFFCALSFIFYFFIFQERDAHVISTRGGCKKRVMMGICYLSPFALSVRCVQDRDRLCYYFLV
jgi:hypothetical protein